LKSLLLALFLANACLGNIKLTGVVDSIEGPNPYNAQIGDAVSLTIGFGYTSPDFIYSMGWMYWDGSRTMASPNGYGDWLGSVAGEGTLVGFGSTSAGVTSPVFNGAYSTDYMFIEIDGYGNLYSAGVSRPNGSFLWNETERYFAISDYLADGDSVVPTVLRGTLTSAIFDAPVPSQPWFPRGTYPQPEEDSPVPEPSTLLFSAPVLLGFLGYRRLRTNENY